MEWVRTHPYACAIFSAGVLLVAGVIVVITHSSLAPSSGFSAWSGGTGSLINSGAAPAQQTIGTQQEPVATSTQADESGTLPYTTPSQIAVPTSGTSNANSSAELQALLIELSHPSGSASAGTQTKTSATATAYAYIPSGLISVSSPSQSHYTVAQQELYGYGNAAGTIIKDYESRDAGQTQVLTNSIQSRQDQSKSAAVAQVGQDLITMGKKLAAIPDTPAQAAVDGSALAQSYEATGAALEEVAAATNQTDSSFVASMQAYDTVADALVKHYAALSLLFSSNGIVFSPSDAGSVFSFSTGTSF